MGGGRRRPAEHRAHICAQRFGPLPCAAGETRAARLHTRWAVSDFKISNLEVFFVRFVLFRNLPVLLSSLLGSTTCTQHMPGKLFEV